MQLNLLLFSNLLVLLLLLEWHNRQMSSIDSKGTASIVRIGAQQRLMQIAGVTVAQKVVLNGVQGQSMQRHCGRVHSHNGQLRIVEAQCQCTATTGCGIFYEKVLGNENI